MGSSHQSSSRSCSCSHEKTSSPSHSGSRDLYLHRTNNTHLTSIVTSKLKRTSHNIKYNYLKKKLLIQITEIFCIFKLLDSCVFYKHTMLIMVNKSNSNTNHSIMHNLEVQSLKLITFTNSKHQKQSTFYKPCIKITGYFIPVFKGSHSWWEVG